ncbi:MAG TPA: hypothetical protein DCE23_06775 [Firmicutes bacterium]|nr:hypothetical protein [Bacillota bacterium]
MKIIADSISTGTCCFVQVRDLKYIWETSKNRTIRDFYLSLEEKEISQNDFVKVVDADILNTILNEEAIIDFSEYMKRSYFGLATEILNRVSDIYNYGEKKKNRHMIDDLKDIIAYKNKSLDYRIPIVSTGRIVYMSCNLAFSTTQFDNVYLFKTLDGDDASKPEYRNFLLECILSMYDIEYSSYDRNSLDYSLIKEGNMMVVTIKATKKKSFAERLSKRIGKVKDSRG